MKEQWETVNDFNKGATFPTSNQEMMAVVMTNLENKSKQPKAASPAPAKKAEAAPAKKAEAPAAAAPASTGLKSENIFGMMATYLG